MARRRPPRKRKVTYFELVLPRLARNIIIESTFDVGRRFRCTMRVDCGQLDPGAVIRPVAGEWRPRMPERQPAHHCKKWVTPDHSWATASDRCGRQPGGPRCRRETGFLEHQRDAASCGRLSYRVWR